MKKEYFEAEQQAVGQTFASLMALTQSICLTEKSDKIILNHSSLITEQE